MKYHSQDLLTLLISLFIFSSCTNPSLVGLDIDDRDQIQGQFNDDQVVQAYTFQDVDVITAGTSVMSLGYLKDPSIGESSASFAFALGPLQSGDSRLPKGITIDSAVLVMNYSNSFFGDTTLASTYNIEVNQLKNPYKFNEPYRSNHVWETVATPIGTKSIKKFAYKDSILIAKKVDKKDTIIRVAPQLRIPLDKSKIKDLFDSNIDSATFANSKFFHERMKGFYVKVNQSTSQDGVGGIALMALNTEVNGIEVYYKLPDSTSQSVRRYAVSASQSAAALTHTYTPIVQDELQAATKDQTTVFVQGLGGLSTAILFPNIEDLKIQGLVVNKAELVIYVDSDVTGTSFTTQAPRLTLYRKDIAGQVTPVPDGDTRQNVADPRSFGLAYGGFYEKDKKRYTFKLTSYVQDILLGKSKNKELYLTVANGQNFASVPFSPDFLTSSRAILGGGNNTKYKMKLNLYTSKVKQQ